MYDVYAYMYYIYIYIYIYLSIYLSIYRSIYLSIDLSIYLSILQLCVPLSENVNLQFIQKDIFLFKISYISVCSKTFLIYILYIYGLLKELNV